MQLRVSHAIQEPTSLSRWTSRIALFSLVLVIAAAILHRLFGMPTPVAFNLVRVAYLGVGLCLLTAAAAGVVIWRTGAAGTASIIFGVFLSLVMLSGPAILLVLAEEAPPINDLTTNPASPPEFSRLALQRGPGANPAAYPGEKFALEQARAYPDLKPMFVNRSSEEAFELAVDALKRLKMDIVREEAPAVDTGEPGMIEAVDRTLIAGFYDDVAIRVSGNDKGARVDIRSASRYGWTDLGANAERIRTIIREIAARLDATVPTAGAERALRAKRPGLVKPGKEDDPTPEARRRSRDGAR